MNSPPPTKVFDVTSIKDKWSDEKTRVARINENDMKVHSLKRNSRPLCGGDFVLNQYGGAATVAFCFVQHYGGYGMTTAHLFDETDDDDEIIITEAKVGDPVFAFNSDVKDASGQYPTVKIGKVVAIDRDVDACIFKVFSKFYVEDSRIYPFNGRHFHIKCKDIDPNVGPMETTVVGNGAQRRGAVGRFKGCYGRTGHSFVKQDDLRITSFDPSTGKEGQVKLTDQGDCGMLWFDEFGDPCCMHHALMQDPVTGEYSSYGVSFRKILDAFPAYFGLASVKRGQSASKKHRLQLSNKKPPPSNGAEWSRQSSPSRPLLEKLTSPNEIPEARRLKFDTVKVEAPSFHGVPPYRSRNRVKMVIVEATPYSGLHPDDPRFRSEDV